MKQRRSQFRLAAMLAVVSLALLTILVLHDSPPIAEPPLKTVFAQPAFVPPADVEERSGAEPAFEGEASPPVRVATSSAIVSIAVQVVNSLGNEPVPHAELLLDPSPDGVSQWLRVNGDGRAWLELPEAWEQVVMRVRASGFAEARVTIELEGEQLTRVIELRPIDGYIGRVTTTLGDGIAGARVTVWRSWPARPAFVYSAAGADSPTDGAPRAAVLAARSERLVELVTDALGYYRIGPLDERNVVDLVVAVAETKQASAPLRVPMPHPGNELPDLVVYPVTSLRGQVVDPEGNPVVGVSIEFDASPGAVRTVERVALTDGSGHFSFDHHLGTHHLRVQAPDHELRAADHLGLDLPLVPSREPRRSAVDTAGMIIALQPPWIRLDPGLTTPRVELANKGHVSGVVTGTDGRGVGRQALLTLSTLSSASAWEVLAVERIHGDWSFHLTVPARDANRQLRLSVSDAHYEPYEVDVAATAHPGDVIHRVELVPTARQEELMLPIETGGSVDLYAFAPQGSTPLLDAAGAFQVPTDRAPFWTSRWEGVHRWGPGLGRTVPIPPSGREGVMILGWERNEWLLDQVIAFALDDLDDSAAPGSSALNYAPPRPFRVDVRGEVPEHRVQLRTTTWLPWLDIERRYDDELRSFDARFEVTRLLSLPTPSRTRIELVESRDPVDLVHDWIDEFEVSPDETYEPLTLTIPAHHLLTGAVVDHVAGDWPDLAVALCGPATAVHRREALGQTSCWERPSEGFGAFRFEHVPEGVYTFLLYRTVDDSQVDVLARRTVTVGRDLYQLDIWEEPMSSPLRELVQGY